MESKTSGYDSNNQYYTKVVDPTAKQGFQRKPLKLDHFKTNFSLECKGDLSPNTEYDNQRTFQPVNFGKTFDSVVQDKTFIHTVDTFLIPADSHEITYSDTPADNDTASAHFGRRINMNDSGGTAIVSFFGVACGAAFGIGTSNGAFTVELSSDNGSTYTHKKTFTTDVTTGNTPDVAFLFYDSLPIGEYKIKITQIVGTLLTQLGYVWYTTYCNQSGVEQYYLEATAAKSVATDLPPCTFKLVGAWNSENDFYEQAFGGVYSWTSTDAEYFEFYFYGSRVWVNLIYDATNSSGVTTPLIDGATTYLKSTTFTTYAPNNERNVWVRIDNGALEEGWHTLRLTKTSGASYRMNVSGVAYYSTNTQTTVTKPVICGKNSYFVGIDDAAWTRTGSWTVAEGGGAIYRRIAHTSTNTDTTHITTPNVANLKAIYLCCDLSTARGNITTSLGGDAVNLRYLNTDTADYTASDAILLLYDSFRDGGLSNKVLKITKVDGTTFLLTGVIYEIGDACENSYLWAFPKLNHMRVSTSLGIVKSNTYRLDVYGICSEGGNWASPYCFSPWAVHTAAAWYWRTGFIFYPGKDQIQMFFNATVGSIPVNSQARTEDPITHFGNSSVPGVVNTTTSNADIGKLVVNPHRVI